MKNKSIPKFVAPCLWSCNINKLDFQKDKQLIITQVLKYGGGAAFYSSWVEEGNWARIKFDNKDRNFIKFREATNIGKDWWILPKASTCCSIVTIGNSVKEVQEKVQEIAKSVKMPGSSLDNSSVNFIEINKALEEAKKYGIDF